MRPRARFRMPLEAEGRHVGTMNALNGPVEQRHMGDLQGVRQRFRIDIEAVVLTGDHHGTVLKILHRMVGTVVAMLHLHRARPAGEAEQLVAQTDTCLLYTS